MTCLCPAVLALVLLVGMSLSPVHAWAATVLRGELLRVGLWRDRRGIPRNREYAHKLLSRGPTALVVCLSLACNATSEFQEPIVERAADAGPPRPGSPFGDRAPPPEVEPSPPPTEDPPEPPMCVSSLPMQGGGPAPTYFKASNT